MPEQHKVVVESLANSGDGVGRINEKVVFIPYACPGDELLIELTTNKKTFAKAKIVEILNPSEDRIIPECQFFGDCGGCDWQHINYKTQTHWKVENLKQSLTRIGKIEVSHLIQPIQESPKKLEYRNRIQLNSEKHKYFYYQKNSNKKCYIDQCLLADPLINNYLKENQGSDKKQKNEYALMNDHVDVFYVSERGQSDLGFRQVNDQQNLWIQKKVLEWLEDKAIKNVLDLYCGQGNWALEISKNFESIQCLGIDNNSINIDIADQQSNKNCHFKLGDSAIEITRLDEHFDLTIIDPPRAGCSPEFIENFKNLSTDYLIYISCDPATLARDLGQLLQSGWDLESIHPIDMFPQTAHLECLCFLHSAKTPKTANY